LTTADFILRSKAVHVGAEFTYGHTHYTGALRKVTITCPKHGDFEQVANDHLRHAAGCSGCVGNRRHTAGTFCAAARQRHGIRYSYEGVVYVNNRTPVVIICRIHGPFSQRPGAHLARKSGCPQCAHIRRRRARNKRLGRAAPPYTRGAFIAAAAALFPALDYSRVVYRAGHTKVTVVCPEHDEFTQTPNNHLAGTGCPRCRGSRGELLVRCALVSAGVEFVEQWQHPTLRHKQPLSIDFAVPSAHVLVEFDGVFHFRPVRFPGQTVEAAQAAFEGVRLRDAIKDQWATDNGWQMVRLSRAKTVEQDLRAAGVIP